MQLALEAPITLMDRYLPLSDFDFILPHLMDTPGYTEYYTQSDKFKILDNSTHELRYPYTVDQILEAAKTFKPDFVCPPDYLQSATRTLYDLEEMEAKIPSDIGLLPILQSDGESYESVKSFIQHLKSRRYQCIAVPSVILIDRNNPLEKLGQTRYEIVSYLAADFDWIHLLGCNHPHEILMYRKMDNVRSIDTGSPITNGCAGRRFGIDEPLEKKDAMLNFDFTDLVPAIDRNVMHNIAYMRTLLTQEDEWLSRKREVLE